MISSEPWKDPIAWDHASCIMHFKPQLNESRIRAKALKCAKHAGLCTGAAQSSDSDQLSFGLWSDYMVYSCECACVGLLVFAFRCSDPAYEACDCGD